MRLKSSYREYTPPTCTVCGSMATCYATQNKKEPRCTRHQVAKPETRLCPFCNALMIIRTNTKNSTSFWGCTNFPRCTGTSKI